MDGGRDRLAVRAIVAIYREFEQLTRRSDMTIAQYRMMLYLRNGPRRAGAIASAAALAKPTVSLAINALRARGWVENVPDSDGRAAVIAISPAGEARMAELERTMIDLVGGLMSPAQFAALSHAMADAYAAMAATKDERLKSVEDSLTG